MSQNDADHRLIVPPQSVGAEQAVLGGLMLVPDAIDLIADILKENDFYRRDHRLIYRGMCELSEKNIPIDAVTLGEFFTSHMLSEQVGGNSYLIELAATTPSAANIRAYAEIVREKSILRQVIESGTEIVNFALKPDGQSAQDVLAKAEETIFSIGDSGSRGSSKHEPIQAGLKDAFEQLRLRYESEGALSGISTGYADLDVILSGLNNSDLIVLAARPSMGKTALALNIAEYVAIKGKKCVVAYSMEMSKGQLVQRMISSVGRVDASKMRSGDLDDDDWGRINMAMKTLNEANIIIDDTPGLTPDTIRSRVRRLCKENDVALVVVDYMQLMTTAGTRENRNVEVSEISRGLKALAKEINRPVLALSQLNRGLESRADKRPNMSDLRESGAIEQDADVIAFIYRDDYYNKDSSEKGLAELIIAKQRNGPTGEVKLRFFGKYSRFDNLSKYEPM